MTWVCAGGVGCGGIGDSTRGLARLFIEALDEGAEFAVRWANPHPINPDILALRPPFDAASVAASDADGKVWSFVDGDSSWNKKCDWPKRGFGGSEHGSIRIRTNNPLKDDTEMPCSKSAAVTKWLQETAPWQREGCVFWHLFDPGADLAAKLDEEFSVTPRFKVAMHVRAGDAALGVGGMKFFGSHRDWEQDAMLACARAKANGGTIYVATDSHRLKMRWANEPDVYIPPSKAAHTDKGASKTQLINAFVELLMLASADTLVMSNSGYSRMARSIGGTGASAVGIPPQQQSGSRSMGAAFQGPACVADPNQWAGDARAGDVCGPGQVPRRVDLDGPCPKR